MPFRFDKALIFLVLSSMGLGWAGFPAAQAVQGSGLRLSDENSAGLTLELTTPDFRIEQGQADGQACQIIRIDGYGSTNTPGYPELPVHGFLVGIPPLSKPELTQSEPGVGTIVGRYDLCPAARPVLDNALSEQTVDRGEVRLRDTGAYNMNSFAPENQVELVTTGFLRSQRVAKVLFQPFQYNPLSHELRVFSHIQARLSFSGVENVGQLTREQSSGYYNESDFETLLKNSLVNYVDARQMRSRPQPQSTNLSQDISGNVGYPSYKLSINQDGIYQVTYEDLVAAGANFTDPPMDPHTFRLFKGGDYRLGLEIAIQVEGEYDNTFDPGDRIIFYGQKVNTRYTNTNVYYLTWGGDNGLRMPVLNGMPDIGSMPESFLTTQHIEENKRYLSNYPSGTDNDVWYYWNYIYANPGPDSKVFTTTLNHPSSSVSLTAKVRGLLKGYLVEGTNSNPEHHARIYFNGHLIDEAWWPLMGQYSFEVPITQTLISDNNTIRIERPAEAGITRDIILVNWFEIDYWKTFVAEVDRLDFSGSDTATLPAPLKTDSSTASAVQFQVTNFSADSLEVYDVTNPNQVARVTPVSVLPDGEKYKLIFQQTLSGEYRYIAQSRASRLSPLSIMKDELSDLHSDLNAADYILITHSDFYTDVLRLADYRAAQGLRTQVVKVEDIYDEFSGGVMTPQAIRVFLAYAYQHWQPPAPLYVLLVGDGNFDPRNYYGTGEPIYIPVYLEQVDPWLGETLTENRFVTVSGTDDLPDMFIGRLPVKTSAEAAAMVDKILAYEQIPPDFYQENWHRKALFVADAYDPGAGDFADYSNQVADHYLPQGYDVQKVYYGVTHNDINAARAAIIDSINQGALLVNYVGHGSVQFWGMNNLLSVNSISSLNNSGKLPFMVPMTCLEGSFDYPSPPGKDNSSMAERLVREPGKGAIASFSPAGFGVTSGHDFLNKGLYDAIFVYNMTHIGPATTQAKLYLFANSGGLHWDLIDTYVLLGDPALHLSLVYKNYIPMLARSGLLSP